MREQLNPTGRCEMALLVQAEFDGELDAAQAARLQAHRTQCTNCQAAELELTGAPRLSRGDLYQPAPEDVWQRILVLVNTVQPRPVLGSTEGRTHRPVAPALLSRFRSWRQSTIGFGLGAACVATLALLVLTPAKQSLTEQVVAGHVRALQPGHLEDVISTDQHTVKPWFDGRVDFSPPVKDLGPVGFPLKGGRLDYIAGRPVAALVYQRGKHIIDMFVWPTAVSDVPGLKQAEHNGYNIVHWSQSGTEFWVVSDTESSQLRDFVQYWQRLP